MLKDMKEVREIFGYPLLRAMARRRTRRFPLVKDYCNYIFDTFGRFPATFDTIVMPEWLQVHHLEQEFYDKYGLDKLLNETHRKHMELWHK